MWAGGLASDAGSVGAPPLDTGEPIARGLALKDSLVTYDHARSERRPLGPRGCKYQVSIEINYEYFIFISIIIVAFS